MKLSTARSFTPSARQAATLHLLASAIVLAALSIASGVARANDFPTSARVLYVEDCMRANPGPYFEMVNKCSCAIDAMAAEVKYDEYTTCLLYTSPSPRD